MLIAEIRKEKGRTQLEPAEKMGVTDKAVSKWERDLSCPDIHSLPAPAEILGVSMDQLMRLTSGRAPSQGRTDRILDTIFPGVALSMGVAVAVLAGPDALDIRDTLSMPGIGLSCMAVSVIRSRG